MYAIRCTPGGLLCEDSTGIVLTFNSYAEAETEALRLTKAAYDNPSVAGFDFTPVEMPAAEGDGGD